MNLFTKQKQRPPDGAVCRESVCNAGDHASIPGLGRSPGEGKSYQPSILAWRIPGTIQFMGDKQSHTTELLSLHFNGDTDIDSKCMDTQGAEEECDELGDWDCHIYTAMCKIDN